MTSPALNRPVDVLHVIDTAMGYARASDHEQSEADLRVLEKARAAVAELMDAHAALCRAYVRLMEAARDRIVEFGGQCDPVDVMERSDPWLARSRAALAAIGSAK